jgi:DNA-binding CsgD family transcriptional regulator
MRGATNATLTASLAGLEALPPRLTEVSLAVYRHAALRGGVTVRSVAADLALDFDEAARACADLRSLRLLIENFPDDVLTPVHPDVARARWSEPLVDEIEARRFAIEVNDRQLTRVSEVLATAADRVSETAGIRVIVDPGLVAQEISTRALACVTEFIATQPGGPRRDSQLPDSVRADVAMLNRGVTRRLLFQHTARANLGMRSYVGQLTEHGGQIRTTPEALERMLIFDRKIAILPLEPPGTQPGGSVVITHAPVVEFLHRGFERLWSSAVVFEDTDSPYEEVSVDIKVSLLRLMASGLKDDAIAHRLGIATRTCRRYVSSIMDELNVTSRFQAGVKIAQLGLLPDGGATTASVREADSYPWW